MLGIAKRLVLKPAQSRSSSKPTRRMLSLVGTWSLDPKQATFREQEMLPLSPAEPFPRTFPRKYKWSSFQPFPFPHLLPPTRGNLSEYFDSYRQNHILTHAKEMNPTCLQSLCYETVDEGWRSPSPWKMGLLQSMAGTHALHRALLTPTQECPACCRTCCSSAWQTHLFSSRRPETQWLNKLFISRALPNAGHLYETHLLVLT